MALGFEDISQWDIIAANNGTVDSAIDFHEHQTRASVNDSARSVMAAIAKQRNMTNGSIVTAGSNNAQTFTTPVNYGAAATPTGLRVRLKIGVAWTTGTLTLTMDSGAAAGVKNLKGNAPIPAEWPLGGY